MNAPLSKKPNLLMRGDLAFCQAPGDVLGISCGQTTADAVEDIATLASLYLKGVRKVICRMPRVQPDDAADWRRLDKAMSRFNRLLEARGLGGMSLRKVRPEQPQYAELSRLLAGPVNPSRRSFLTHASAQIDQIGEDSHEDLRMLQVIEGQGKEAVFAAVPVVDPERCTACDACTRVCPTGALSLVAYTEQAGAYRISAEFCNGCALCTDICAADAISISLVAPAVPEIDLTTHHCPACRASFHQLRDHAGETEQSHCQICSQTGHYKKLHQVWTI